ncbi:MAG: class I SAM-dependent methyltransferase [Nocardioidaceae bacterium]
MTSPHYFDALYAAADDPWGLASRPYEARKYALSVACLPRPRYRRGFEPGCSIGILTAQLAGRCDELIAWDGAESAVRQARARVTSSHVRIEHARIPSAWPAGTFDLIVISELLYFLDRPDRQAVVTQAIESLQPSGHLLAVHWRHRFDQAPGNGDEAHAELLDQPRLAVQVEHVEADFLLHVLIRSDS